MKKKHKMAILIEIPLNVETEQEATEQMMKANAKEFECMHDMIRTYKGKINIERKLI